MKTQYLRFSIVVALLLCLSGVASVVTAQTPVGQGLTVISAERQKLVVELTVDEFEIETIVHDGETYHRLLIPDAVQTSDPGQPQLPTLGSWVGVSSPDGVSVKLMEAESEILAGQYNLYPAPDWQVVGSGIDQTVKELFTLDRQAYQQDSFSPRQLVEAGDTGYIRDQAVAQLQLYPAQYNPVSGELKLYRRLVVEVSWDGAGRSASQQDASPVFDEILQNTLLNYDSLDRPAASRQSRDGRVNLGARQTTTNTLKIMVNDDGLYRVNLADLTTAGMTNVDPASLKLTNRGQNIPIQLNQDHFLFYGTAITDIYTTENLYWLTTGATNPARMTERSGTPAGATVPTQFPATIHAEEDTFDKDTYDGYWQNMPDGAGQDHWFWGQRLTPGTSRDFSIIVNNPSATVGNKATIRVRLKGRSVDAKRSRISLNGTQIDDQTWDGMAVFDHVIEVDQSLLRQGNNTITVEAAGTMSTNIFYVNWFEIDYLQTYQAVNDALYFAAPTAGTFQFEVTGFTTDTVQIFDVTNPNNLVRISNATVAADGSSFKLAFQDTAQATTKYLALTSPTSVTAAHLKLDEASNWRTTTPQADYIIITHRDFYTSSMELATYRSQQSNLDVAVVKVEDVYDEFNFGIFNPQAIQDFLKYAYNNWNSNKPAKPAYVLLVGDANIDYLNNFEAPPINYVPTQIVETDLLGQTPSDNWFVELVGDDVLPDMVIGRLAPRTETHNNTMINKIKSYEGPNKPDDSWNKNVLLIADDGVSGEEFDDSFEIISNQLAQSVPYYFNTTKVYVNDYTSNDNPTTDIINAFNQGSLLVNYTGHGDLDLWGKWDRTGDESDATFNVSDVGSLTNDDKLSIVTVANCLSGYFVIDDAVDRNPNDVNEAMAEALLESEGKGAVAVWAPTGLGYPAGHRELIGEFYDQIFQDDHYVLGGTTTQTKIEVYGRNNAWRDLVETFVFFGDPAMAIGVPTNYPYLESSTPANGATNVPIDDDVKLVFNKPVATNTITLNDGGAGLNWAASWNSSSTIVTYTHQMPFTYGQTISLSVTGQDLLGNQLQAKPDVPLNWSFTAETYLGVQTVAITGPTEGATGANYEFTAIVSPISATTPISYSWQATDVTEPFTSSDSVELNWEQPGIKVITVTAMNDNGSATASRQITLSSEALLQVTTGVSLTHVKNDRTVFELVGPEDAVVETVRLSFFPLMQPTKTVPNDYQFAGHAFQLNGVYIAGNVPVEPDFLELPLNITIRYSDADVVGLDENKLRLYFWNETTNTWVDAVDGCPLSVNQTVDSEANELTLGICHLSEFALLEGEVTITRQSAYLPIIIRQDN